MQTAKTRTAASINARQIHRALGNPARHSRFKPGIGNHVRPAVDPDLDVVDQAFALTQQIEMQGLTHSRPQTHPNAAGELNRRPCGLAGLVAVPPVVGPSGIRVGIDQFKTAPAAVRPIAPLSAILIGDLVHHHVHGLFASRTLASGTDRHRSGQGDAFPASAQSSAKVPEAIPAIQFGIRRPQTPRVLRHHHQSVGRQHRIRGKGETNPMNKGPIADGDGLISPIDQLHILITIGAGDGMIHDLMDHHRRRFGDGIGQSGRGRRQPGKLRDTIGKPTKRDPGFLRRILDRVHHPVAFWIEQEESSPPHVRNDSGFRPGEPDKSPGTEHGSHRNSKPRCRRIVRQAGTRKIQRLVGVVVELNIAVLPRRRGDQNFVEHESLETVVAGRLGPAGRATHPATGFPRARVSLAERRTCQHHRMAAARSGDRPRRGRFNPRLQQHRTEFILQNNPTCRTPQGSAERSGHVGDSEPGGKIGRGFGHHEIAPRFERRAVGKSELDASAYPKPAEFRGNQIGVEQFDKFQLTTPGRRSRVMQDLGDGQAGSPARGSEPFRIIGRRAVPDAAGQGHQDPSPPQKATGPSTETSVFGHGSRWNRRFKRRRQGSVFCKTRSSRFSEKP